MKRKNFIKRSIIAAAAILSGSKIDSAAEVNDSKTKDILGYNHIPNKEKKTMNTVLHKAKTRGHANHGWLDTHHTFSFANYYNPERMNFGVLRVLNDDEVSEGRGFGTHPHDNMEIISIPLEGDLEHKDSMGNTTIIQEGDVQVMSAGTGIFHSEYNKNKDKKVKFLQIWVLPKEQNVNPRYDQITLDTEKLNNNLLQILSPNKDDEGVWINQDAWFHIGNLEVGKEFKYNLKNKNNGVYAFLLEGDVTIEDQELNKRDGLGVWETDNINIKAESNSKVLLMEVPMS